MIATSSFRRAALCCAVALLATAAGCGGDKNPNAPESITGTYTMRTVNGSPPPTVIAEYTDEAGTYKLEVLSGSITLEQGGSYRESHTFRETIAGVVQPPEEVPEGGTWVRDGNAVTLRTSDGFAIVATYASGALTLAQGPFTVRYTR